MRRFCTFTLLLILCFAVTSSLVLVKVVFSSVIWSQTYQKVGGQGVSSMVQTSDRGFAMTGSTDAVDPHYDVFPPDYGDGWFVKTDAFGNMEWNKTYGGEEGDYVHSLIVTSDGGFALAGHTESFDARFSDFWLVKIDAQGNVKWNYTYGLTYNDYGYSVIETSDGGFALAGYGLTGRLEDFLLAKTDSSGNMQWNKTYGGEDRDRAYSVVETSDGGFALAGFTSDSHSDFWLVKTDSSGNMLWNKTYGGDGLDRAYSVIESSDGGFLLAGQTKSFGFESIVYWLVKTDGAGNMEWNKNYGESLYWGGYPVIETSDGGFAFASRLYTSWETTGYDCWLVKTDNQGSVVLNQTYAEEENQSVGALIETSDGGFAIGGSTHVFDRDGDFWLLKTDEYGIPEFPSWLILPLFLIATLFVIVIKKRIF